MWRLVREDRSLRFWRVLILYPPTRRRRCNLSTFSVTPCTADYGTAVRAVAGRGLGTGYCDNSLTYTPPRNRTRCARRVLLRRPVVEPLQLCHKLLPASRSDTDLCSNCLVLWSARYVLHFEQEIHYHRRLSHIAVHSHCSPAAERICRQWNTSANILRFALHGGQRHGSTSSSRSGSEQDIAPTP